MTTNKPTIYYFDTSALLSGALEDKMFQDLENIYISPTVLDEIEHIKTDAHKDNDVKFRARKLVRHLIDYNDTIQSELFSQKEIEKVMKANSFLERKNDSVIIAEAVLLSKKYDIIFVTQDICQYLIVDRKFPLLMAFYYHSQEHTSELWSGWTTHTVNDTLLSEIYSTDINVLEAKENEYCVLYDYKDHDKPVDIVCWRNGKYEQLHDKPLNNAYIGEKIKARNIEQRMAIDLLLNEKVKVKLLLGNYGSGKTLLGLTYALDQIGRGKYDKLVFVRNNIVTANTKDIGFLPGDVRDKTKIWAMCLADHLGDEYKLDEMLDNGLIEVFPISHIRGRSIKRSIIICDESENLTKEHVQLLLGRVEQGSEIVFCGDIRQIDAKIFESNNGLRSMIEVLADNPLFGMVKLIKSERGEVAKLADKFDKI